MVLYVSLGSFKFAIGNLLFAIALCKSLFAFVSQVGFRSVAIRPKSVRFF